MNRIVRLSVCTFAVLALAGAVPAATVELGMVVDVPQGTWQVYAWAPGSDHDGISGYNIEIANYIEGTQFMPVSSFNGVAFAGFKFGGSPIPDAMAGDSLFAAMIHLNPESVWYGVGSPDTGDPGSGARIEGPTVEPPFEGQQVPWWDDEDLDTSTYGPSLGGVHFIIPGSGILVGRGTFDSSSRGGWTEFGSSTVANVWEFGSAANNGTNAEAAQINLNRVVIIPEPATFTTLGIAFLGLLGLRRRR